MGFGFFGGGNESTADDFSGSQNQGFNDVDAGEGGIVNVGQAGGKNNRLNLRVYRTETDQGAVRESFAFAKDVNREAIGFAQDANRNAIRFSSRALDWVAGANRQASEAQESALDVVSGLKAKQFDSQSKQLGTIVVVALLGLGAIDLISKRRGAS